MSGRLCNEEAESGLSVPVFHQGIYILNLLSLYVVSPQSGMEWFPPFLYTKLVVSHLVREEPYSRQSKAFRVVAVAKRLANALLCAKKPSHTVTAVKRPFL